MPDPQPGLTSKDFREQYQVSQLQRKTNGATATADPLQQVFDDTRKMSAVKMMQQADKSLDVELLKADNEKLKTEIEHQQLVEQRGGPQASGNPWQEYLFRQLETVQGRLDTAQQRAEAAQAAILEDRLRMLQDELARAKSAVPEVRDEFETAIAQVDKALALAERLRPPAPEYRDMGPDPALRRFELTLEADREARKLEAEERRAQQTMDLQLKREALAREEARLEKQAASQERFLTDTVPKLLQLGQQLVETLTARLGQPAPTAAPAAAAVRAEMAPPTPLRPTVIPPGALAMNCQVCQAQIIYRPGWPEVICSSCGATYTESAPEASSAEHAEPMPEENAQAWAEPAREESHEPPAQRGFEQDPAIPA